MNHRVICIITLVFAFGCSCLAIENGIGGNVSIAGMGFAPAAGKAGLLANPADYSGERFKVSAFHSELFGLGIFYDYFEGQIKLTPQMNVGFCYESVSDQDVIDFSGYDQRLFVAGFSFRMPHNFSVGLNVKIDQFELFKENIGSGYSCDIGFLLGDFHLGRVKTHFGLKIENAFSSRKYQTDRGETLNRLTSVGCTLDAGKFVGAVGLNDGRIRLGMEIQLAQYLALRAGFMEGEPTFGLGISRGKLSFDYAFWLSGVGATHRIGSSISF